MRTIRVLDAAAIEVAEAAAWYERARPGLGAIFRDSVEAALDLLEAKIIPCLPVPGVAGKRGAKRLMLKRFPYAVIFCERNSDIVVIAVAHHSRRPGYWGGRAGPDDPGGRR